MRPKKSPIRPFGRRNLSEAPGKGVRLSLPPGPLDPSRAYTYGKQYPLKQPTDGLGHFIPHLNTGPSVRPFASHLSLSLSLTSFRTSGLRVGWPSSQTSINTRRSSSHCKLVPPLRVPPPPRMLSRSAGTRGQNTSTIQQQSKQRTRRVTRCLVQCLREAFRSSEKSKEASSGAS